MAMAFKSGTEDTVLQAHRVDGFADGQNDAVPFELVDDPSDPRLSDYVGLTDPQIKRRLDEGSFFIAEGIEVVKRLIASNIRCRSVVVSPNRLESLRPTLDEVNCPVYVAERHIMSEIVGFDLHRGVIASGERPEPESLAGILSRKPLNGSRHRFAVLHGVNDHENLGAIVRSARAFRVDALVIDPTCADPYYRRSVRVSMGEIFLLPLVRMQTHDLVDAIRQRGGVSIAFTPDRAAMPIDDVQLDCGPLASIFGSEGFGLPEDILRSADLRVRIPVADDVDSLNIGHAAAIAFSWSSKI